MTFTREYQAVVEAFTSLVKNPVVTERTEGDRAVVEVEGDFETLVIQDMEIWGGHIKFEIRDNRIADQNDRESRAYLSEQMPGFGAVMFAPTIALVYRRIQVETRTQTITEKRVAGTVLERKESEWESVTADEWEEITREWGQKVPPSQRADQ
jgi:hypothetical protein